MIRSILYITFVLDYMEISEYYCFDYLVCAVQYFSILQVAKYGVHNLHIHFAFMFTFVSLCN